MDQHAAESDWTADLELLRSSAVAAGIIAAGFFRRELKSWTKGNASPVTEADIQIDQFLRQSLCAARPAYGWLSEESADDGSRLAHETIFVVDPIDGTRGFMRGEDSWTICLSVVHRGQAVAGVVYAPARDELYEAALGEGARLNGEMLTRRVHHVKGPVVPAPGAVHAELAAMGHDYVHGPMLPSLAYRLIQAATGVVDAAVARRGAQDWDIAASALILGECGIVLEDVCLGPVRFNRATTRHGALAAVADASLQEPLKAALIRVYGCPDEADDSQQGKD